MYVKNFYAHTVIAAILIQKEKILSGCACANVHYVISNQAAPTVAASVRRDAAKGVHT